MWLNAVFSDGHVQRGRSTSSSVAIATDDAVVMVTVLMPTAQIKPNIRFCLYIYNVYMYNLEQYNQSAGSNEKNTTGHKIITKKILLLRTIYDARLTRGLVRPAFVSVHPQYAWNYDIKYGLNTHIFIYLPLTARAPASKREPSRLGQRPVSVNANQQTGCHNVAGVPTANT